MHHVVARHGNVTSVRDVVLMSLLLTLCSSTSWRFNDYVLMMLLLNMKKLNTFISVAHQSLAQGRTQLDPFGSAGLVTFQAIAEALFISYFSCGMIHDFFTTRTIVQDWVNASMFSCPVIYGFALRSFLICLTTLAANIPRSSCNLFICQSAVNPHNPFWWFFCSAIRILSS